MEITAIRAIEFKSGNLNFSLSASKFIAKVLVNANLLMPYDRAKCIHLPSTPPWIRIPSQPIISATAVSSTLAENPNVTKNFTDGSVGPKGAGYAAAIYDEKGLLFVIKESLPSYISIFQAEGFAILAALQWILQSAYPLTQKFE